MGMPQGMQAGALGQLQTPAQQRHLGTYRIRPERIAAWVREDQIQRAVIVWERGPCLGLFRPVSRKCRHGDTRDFDFSFLASLGALPVESLPHLAQRARDRRLAIRY